MKDEMTEIKSILSSKNFDVSEDSFGGIVTQQDQCCWFVNWGCWIWDPCWDYEPAPCQHVAHL